MINYCKKNINEIGHLLQNLTDREYALPLTLLSGSSVGQHVRHVLEFYTSLLGSAETRIVDYDARLRQADLENETEAALLRIGEILQGLSQLTGDYALTLHGNYSADTDMELSVPTTLYRELAYNLEHSIHHQALIKMGVTALGKAKVLHEDFGIAPATIRHRRSLSV